MSGFLKNSTFKKPVPIPHEIERLCKKAGMSDEEIQNIWNCRVYLGDEGFHRLQKMWKKDKQGVLILVGGWCASHKDKIDIEQRMANFIKNFPETEPPKWGLQDVPLDKLWVAGNSINMVVKSLRHRGPKDASFTIYTDGTVLDKEKNILEKWSVIGGISEFAKVDLVIASKILKWLINASQYDHQKLLFKDCKSSHVSAGENSYLILS